jgi:hypothetical protein
VICDGEQLHHGRVYWLKPSGTKRESRTKRTTIYEFEQQNRNNGKTFFENEQSGERGKVLIFSILAEWETALNVASSRSSAEITSRYLLTLRRKEVPLRGGAFSLELTLLLAHNLLCTKHRKITFRAFLEIIFSTRKTFFSPRGTIHLASKVIYLSFRCLFLSGLWGDLCGNRNEKNTKAQSQVYTDGGVFKAVQRDGVGGQRWESGWKRGKTLWLKEGETGSRVTLPRINIES